MKSRSEPAAVRWTLPDLVDFEALLARGEASDDAQRRQFVRAVRPRLAAMGDESVRRRAGLRLWLEHCRDDGQPSLGRVFGHGLNLAGWGLFALMAFAGMGLVAGLLLGSHQAVHVIVFFGLTLGLPWLVYCAGLSLRALGNGGGGALFALGRFGGGYKQCKRLASLLAGLTQARATRRVLAATLAGLLQRGAVGFYLGAILAFLGCLLLFDLRFYWEATPRIGMEGLLAAVTQVVALPWAWAWPQAVPGAADITTSRAVAEALPIAGDGNWWRFLLVSLLVWGLLPRLLLLAWCRLQAHRGLRQLTFQAPRQRALWRQLNTIERGEVAPGPTDGVLVLDVGGHGVTGEAIRGFLLRRLRVNPLATTTVAVLDAEQEAQAERQLAAGPAGVVLLAEGWTLSPRQVEALHRRLRVALGARVPMTWLVFALHGAEPGPPAASELQRWTRQIDSLRDPATEVAAYDG